MTKNEFMDILRSREALFGLPEEDIARSLSFYEELIDDRMEEGMSEEEAVADVGDPREIAAQILSEIPLSKLVKERIKPSRRLRAWEIVLLAVGSPIWLALLISVVAILVSLYAVLWSMVAVVWAVVAVLVGTFLVGIAALVLLCIQGSVGTGLILLGLGTVCGGLSLFCWFGAMAATKGAWWLSKKTPFWIKSLFIGKEKEV
ncbi:MAG: DUF1700 domain-containing protein [Clostridia bacterium]|nr:DUF1700 domain-containing protein [Clostridia bacterium]